MTRAAEVSFVGALAYEFSEFLPLLQEHLDFHKALLPHVLMIDFTIWVAKRSEARGFEDELLREVLSFLEESYAAKGELVQELIAVSFLENLPDPGEPGAEVIQMLGPELSKQLERQRN